ncbi:hypothetical protein HOT45_gp55 [Gordonia phage Trine]|uniref:Uncharacterized protein n=1 Tax=Gordonia phage Trine TaxID=2201431 RepID=A0A2Z4Q8Y9_9CAUD|nr:hypothetical protein HOT45_gp55 [Gordonia phage Trine]AWY06556.1 hypothetical protein PBI_TRINE_55 [Gordonia phage Trine]
MTDPAIAAAQRATNGPINGPVGAFALQAAREALAPIRDLHQPARDGAWTVCLHCSIGASFVPWPCATALHAYSDHELESPGPL